MAAVPGTPPSEPIQDFSQTSSLQITVTYGALTTDDETGGSDILGYDLWRDDGNNGDFYDMFESENILGLSYTDIDVVPGNTYRYKYRARNANGYGPFSDVGYMFAADVPDAPPAPVSISVDATQITLELIKPLFNGGSEVIENYLEID